MITNEVIIDSIATGQNIKKLMKLHNILLVDLFSV